MQESLRLGFACKILNEGDNINIKSLVKRRLTEANVLSLIDYNIDVLYRQFQYLKDNGIRVFRMCSDVIPFGSSTEFPFDWQKTFSAKLRRLGEFAKKCMLRLSMHPGQYTVLNALNGAVFKNAVMDLDYHVGVLDAMDMDKSCKIVLHGGGVYLDKELSARRFEENYLKLSDAVKNRLILENDHNRFNALDILGICRNCGCPFVFDLHHDLLNPCSLSPREILLLASKTWRKKDGPMKVHYSQSGINSRGGAHSETIAKEEFLSILPLFKDLTVDLMLEVKDKNISALNCKNWLALRQNTID